MAKKMYEFGLGHEVVTVELPEEQVIHEIEGRVASAIEDVPTAVREALRHPIGLPPLQEVVTTGDKVAIVVSDITRAWINFHQFLPTILDELNEGGIPDQDICIVISLGSHRAHAPAEDVIVCGDAVCQRVPVYQHNSQDSSNLVYTGTTSRGVKCYLNKRVAEADKVIVTGGIVYHLFAGFGGGRKSIMPGVSGYQTIQDNHCLALHPEAGKGSNPACGTGKLVGNPVHEDMMEAAAFAKPAFLFNVVFTPEGKFTQFLAGHWQKAWEEGCKLVTSVFGIPITAKADLVVASAGGYPKDINLYQGAKSICNAYDAVKSGGVVICFLECQDISEPLEFSNWFNHPTMLEFEIALRKEFTIPGFIAFKLALIARDVSMIIVSKPENADFIRNTGMIPAVSAEEAMEIAYKKLGGKDFTITVMAHAANTAPVL